MYAALGQALLGLAPYLTIALGLVLLGLVLYTSTLTFALRSYSRSRIAEKLPEESQRPWLDWLDEHEEELQVSASLVRLTLSLFVLGWVGSWFVDSAEMRLEVATIVATGLLTLLLLILFALGIPHALTLHAGEAILARSLRVLSTARLMLWPFVRALMGVEFVVRRLLGKPEASKEEESERMEQEILDAVSEGKAHGAVDEEQEDMIESVFELQDTAVSAIMTPRTDMVALRADAAYEETRRVILEAGHSRIPIFDESIDHIVGVLYAKDLLGLAPGEKFDISRIMRQVRYVPETKNVDHLLRELRQNKVHIVIVLDEYGGTAGLVTIEDILEELVGEIDDEYDHAAPPPINRVDDDTLEVDARVHVDEVNEELNVQLPEDGDYETIGGFVFTTLGKIPATGEEFRHEHIHFCVIDAEARKINRLRIHVERQVQSA